MGGCEPEVCSSLLGSWLLEVRDAVWQRQLWLPGGLSSLLLGQGSIFGMGKAAMQQIFRKGRCHGINIRFLSVLVNVTAFYTVHAPSFRSEASRALLFTELKPLGASATHVLKASAAVSCLLWLRGCRPSLVPGGAECGGCCALLLWSLRRSTCL